MINQQVKQAHPLSNQGDTQNNQRFRSASQQFQSDQQPNQIQQLHPNMLSNQHIPQPAQSNLILIGNQQIHGHSTSSDNNNVYQSENPMMKVSLGSIENRNLPIPNFMPCSQTFSKDSISQFMNSNTIYPQNNCVSAYLNNINNNNNNQYSATMFNHQLINQSGKTIYTQGIPNCEGNYGGRIQEMNGQMNPQYQQQLQQLHPNQQQYQLQQSSIKSQIAPELQSSNLYAGYITQMQNNQSGIGFNYERAQMSNQQQAQVMFPQYPIQANSFQQYQGFMMQPNFLQSQNTFSPLSISNIYSEQQNNGLSTLPSQTIIPQVFQNISLGNLNSQSQNEEDQLVLFRKQGNNLNQLGFQSHQISQKTANSQNSSATKEELQDNQENFDNIKLIRKEKSSQPEESQLPRKSPPSFSYNPTTASSKEAQQSQINLTNFDNALSSIIINKHSLQQQNKSMHIIIKKQEEEDSKIEYKGVDMKFLNTQNQNNQNLSVEQSSNNSASQKSLLPNHIIRAYQPYSNEAYTNKGIEVGQQEYERVSQKNNRSGQISFNICKQNQQDNLSQQSISSSPPSKKENNQLTSRYRQVQEDKSNNSQIENLPTDQQSSIVEVYVDNRKRSTSIDHSFYLQLGSLLTDKKVINEFTNLILFQGIEGIIPNLNNKISDYNSIEYRQGNSEGIKKYKQLLNQTFYEMKHSNQLSSFTPLILNEEQILKIEESDENQEFKQTNFASFNQKSQNAHSIVDSIEKAILTKIPLLFKDDFIIDSFKLIPSGQYQVYSNLQNMCIQFVRGEKRKRFKERNKDSQYMSRFHNLNRLFFYQIMSMYSYESLSCFQIDPTISEQLRIIISFIKIHSKLQLINQKSKNSSVTSSLNKKQSQEVKVDKRKISSLQQNNDEDFENCQSTTKQLKKDNSEGRIITAISQESDKSLSKKQQKIKEKKVNRNLNLDQEPLIDSNLQDNSYLNFENTRGIKKKHSIGQESQTYSVSINENLSRNRASTYGESTKAPSEKNIIILKEDCSFNKRISIKQQQAYPSIRDGINHEQISQTLSPVLKSIEVQNQDTLKKNEATKQSDLFSLSNDNDINLANLVTAKKYSSINQDTIDSEEIQVEIEDNTYQTPSNHLEPKNFSSSKKTDAFPKIKPAKQSRNLKNTSESETSREEKIDVEASSKEEVYSNNQKEDELDFEEEDDDDDDDDDEEDIDFPIKNYKKYYRILKVENYTHSHYNTLFLKLNASSMEHLKKQSKDVDSHWLAYKIDLRKPELIPSEKIQFVNLIKSLFYKIFMHFNGFSFNNRQVEQQKILDSIINDPSLPLKKDSQEFKQVELRLDYYLRVVQGIQKLNQGYYSHKF